MRSNSGVVAIPIANTSGSSSRNSPGDTVAGLGCAWSIRILAQSVQTGHDSTPTLQHGRKTRDDRADLPQHYSLALYSSRQIIFCGCRTATSTSCPAGRRHDLEVSCSVVAAAAPVATTAHGGRHVSGAADHDGRAVRRGRDRPDVIARASLGECGSAASTLSSSRTSAAPAATSAPCASPRRGRTATPSCFTASAWLP